MVCNPVLMSDSELIDQLGGTGELARKLGLTKYSPARVSNWRKRGIPAAVKLSRPDLFLGYGQTPVIGGGRAVDSDQRMPNEEARHAA